MRTRAVIVLALGIMAEGALARKAAPTKMLDEAAATKQFKFSSKYSELGGKACAAEAKAGSTVEEGADQPLICKGLEGFDVRLSYSALTTIVEVKGVGFDRVLGEGMEIGKNLEWRFQGDKPFAVILRLVSHAPKTNAKLVIRGLKGFEAIEGEVDASVLKNANEKAQKLADAAYAMNAKK